MPHTTDLQAALVADHLADLARDGAALRAERERDHRRDHATLGTDASDHRAELAPRRVRLGHWLVAIGEAVAGSRASSAAAPRETTVSPTSASDRSDDSHDPWASAAWPRIH